MRTVETIIQGLKKHIEMSKILEKRDQNFQKILQERNFFRTNAISYSEENKKLQDKVSKLQQKVRDLEIDNKNYRTYLFKNRDIDSKFECKRQEHNLEVLNQMTKDNLQIRSILNPGSRNDAKRTNEELGYHQSQLIIKETFSKNPKEKENSFNANWKMFKKKETFVESLSKPHTRVVRPISNYTDGMKNGLCTVTDKMAAYRPISNLKHKRRLKSCVRSNGLKDKPSTAKARFETKLKGDNFKVGMDNTLSFLLKD